MHQISELDSLLISAMKDKDQLKLDTLRGLKTRIKNEQIARGKDLDQAEAEQIVRSELKRRQEAILSFEQNNRSELAEKEKAESLVLMEFLPPAPNMDEVKQAVDAFVKQNSFTQQDFGKVMSHFKQVYGASIDGSELSALVKSVLS